MVELDHGRFFLGIDEVGVVYLVETWVDSFGPMPYTMESLGSRRSSSPDR
ncbi:hypothetical protein [Streptomyces sp. NPDC058548]